MISRWNWTQVFDSRQLRARRCRTPSRLSNQSDRRFSMFLPAEPRRSAGLKPSYALAGNACICPSVAGNTRRWRCYPKTGCAEKLNRFADILHSWMPCTSVVNSLQVGFFIADLHRLSSCRTVEKPGWAFRPAGAVLLRIATRTSVTAWVPGTATGAPLVCPIAGPFRIHPEGGIVIVACQS